ncbi:MAG: glutathione-dependent formaldehyde dehydrogenase [Clostridiales bacterium]|jgi:S-(hydroxymethyl)glutathione dehydrogenase/alcohol dehydrogenase|nr:glutathione-dependent formaldehyde dehydrogenase [Clostridiales bacterium]
MKAMVFNGIKKISYTDTKDPSIQKSDDLIVRVTSASICGSDLHVLHGFIPHVKHGTVIGHEAVGVVEEIGKEVHGIKKGDRILIPFAVSCGHCWYCQHDLSSQCENSNSEGKTGGVFGYGEMFGGYDGGQAEYIRVPFANFMTRKIPENLTDEQSLFVTDILPAALWGTEQADVKKGSKVVVIGCGPVGLLAQKWAWYMGAERVIAVDLKDYRLAHAQSFNNVETVNANETSAGEYIKEITHGGADSVIDCVGMEAKMSPIEIAETVLRVQGGSKSAFDIASRAVRKGGTISLVGVYGAKYNGFPLGDLFSGNITLKMGQCPAHSYIDKILSVIQSGGIDATDIITHTLPLSEGEQAYTLFEQRKDGCIKVVLKP